MVQALRRTWSAIPIVVRPLLVLALLPIAAHKLFFRGGPGPETARVRHTIAGEEAALPGTEELSRLLTAHPRFVHGKAARCWRETDLAAVRNSPSVTVCRAMVAHGYVDPGTLRPTAKARKELDHSFWDDGSSVHVTIGRPQLRGILKVTPPPQERDHLRHATRVDFAWAWKATNAIGTDLEISRHHRDMRGVAYLSAEGTTWFVRELTLHDAAPDYAAMSSR